MKRIGKLLPIDGFTVILHDTPSMNYVQSLTHLYQPLIGIYSISLYQTLLNESNDQQANLQTHHTLMNYLQIPLPDLYEARLRLEGIGLLKTFQQQTTDQTIYTYELQKPFTPKEFFNDAMLSQLLYHHVGEKKHSMLAYEHVNLKETYDGKDITASFSEVFQTFQPKFEQHNQGETGLDGIDTFVEPLDFSWLEIMLKQRMIRAKDVLTRQNKKTISELATLYDLATYEIEKAVLWALTDENKLNTEELKNACHDLFQTKQQSSIQLTMKQDQAEPKKSLSTKPQTKEEQLIQQFESISPKQLLEDFSSGEQASERELKMIRDVMLSQGLRAPVMNVLVHYVLIQSNMKLSRAYLETIASHWSRANLSSAREAMNFAKSEIEKFKNRKTRTKKQSTEIIPDWFKERKKQQKNGEQTSQTSDKQVEDESEKEEIMKLLQKHSSNNNHVQG